MATSMRSVNEFSLGNLKRNAFGLYGARMCCRCYVSSSETNKAVAPMRGCCAADGLASVPTAVPDTEAQAYLYAWAERRLLTASAPA